VGTSAAASTAATTSISLDRRAMACEWCEEGRRSRGGEEDEEQDIALVL
jgi:hypothetical protein